MEDEIKRAASILARHGVELKKLDPDYNKKMSEMAKLPRMSARKPYKPRVRKPKV